MVLRKKLECFLWPSLMFVGEAPKSCLSLVFSVKSVTYGCKVFCNRSLLQNRISTDYWTWERNGAERN